MISTLLKTTSLKVQLAIIERHKLTIGQRANGDKVVYNGKYVGEHDVAMLDEGDSNATTKD